MGGGKYSYQGPKAEDESRKTGFSLCDPLFGKQLLLISRKKKKKKKLFSLLTFEQVCNSTLKSMLSDMFSSLLCSSTFYDLHQAKYIITFSSRNQSVVVAGLGYYFRKTQIFKIS